MRYKCSLVVLLALIGFISLFYLIIPAQDISSVERRYLETFDRVIHPNRDLQEQPDSNYIYYDHITRRFEAALEDQFPLRASFVTLKQTTETALNDLVLSIHAKTQSLLVRLGLIESHSDVSAQNYPVYGYARLEPITSQFYPSIQLGSYYRLGGSDWLGNTRSPSMSGNARRNVAILSGQLSKAAKQYNIPLYCLLVTTAEDTNWFSEPPNETDCEEYIAQNLPLSCKVARTSIADLADYEQCFFKTDHHMSYIGSERMYETIYHMMQNGLSLSPMYTPIATWNFTEQYGVQYRGSRAAAVEGISSYANVYDDFIAYEYSLPEHNTYAVDLASGESVSIINGRWNAYKAGDISKETYYDHYIHFYGFDETDQYSDSSYLFMYDYAKSNPNGLNLLYLGDSFQRAIREVLAAHMKTTVWLDYRLFQNVSLSDIIEQYDIDAILISGGSFVWMDDGYSFLEIENGDY